MVSEREIIDIFRKRIGEAAPEDVEVFTLGGTGMVMNVDTLVGSTDVPPGTGIADAGFKSVASCASDFAAKGVRPKYGAIAVTVPDGLTREDIENLSEGVAQAAGDLGVRILGGDTGSGDDLVVQVTLLGAADSIVPRGGACEGDAIYVTGKTGYAAAGLAILTNGASAGGAFAEEARRALLRPRPPAEFGAGYRELVTSAMDSSDGLSTCLAEMAGQSGTMFLVEDLPVTVDLAEFAERNGMAAEDLVLDGGEDYEIVFTAPPGADRSLRDLAQSAGVRLTRIGRVSCGAGVYRESGGRRVPVENRGWVHSGFLQESTV